MTSKTFTIENLEYFMMVLARISAFIFSAPVFNQKNIPRKVKALFSVVLASVVFTALDYKPLDYAGIIDFGVLIVTEVVAGLILGFVANICVMILNFAGNLVDMEIGFSMAQEMNNVNNVTSNINSLIINVFQNSFKITISSFYDYIHIHLEKTHSFNIFYYFIYPIKMFIKYS